MYTVTEKYLYRRCVVLFWWWCCQFRSKYTFDLLIFWRM